MDAADLVERRRAELDEVERMMMDAPDLIPHLRQPRAEAQAALLRAEWQLAVEEQAAAPRPTREQLWEFWQDCRILGRRRMSARTKSRAIRWFGPLYGKLPW